MEAPPDRAPSEIMDPDELFVSLHAVFSAEEEKEALKLVKGSKIPSRKLIKKSLELANIGSSYYELNSFCFLIKFRRKLPVNIN